MGTVRKLAFEDTKEIMGNVSRRSVRDVIAEKLATLIASGVLSVGDELPSERELASALSVSRDSVRGAVAILAAHGILRVAHGARTTVAKSDVSALVRGAADLGLTGDYDLEEVHDARLLVESRLAGAAAERVTAELLADLDTSLAAQRACEGDPVRFLLCDREFHMLVYRAAGNDALFDMAMSLYNFLLDHRRRIVAQPGSVQVSLSDHLAIRDAIAAGDAAAASDAFIAHSTRIYTTTRLFLDAAVRT
ncbi:FCD domain-containing protein [uncultured Roseobacter sp.]|uniref:FadR/GntR family transcriptional regulator n=1 Tax=uncultured Roseobacter sp. TaxID=114847 RepID=UPI0026206AE2|nr:FCD domain-containing protein [uncultured Roseobacter sp.]